MGSLGVVVKTLPVRLDAADLVVFQRDMEVVLLSDSPHVVLDLSPVKYLGSAGIEFLLECLSRIVRRDGDMKLAAISPESAALLSLPRVERFFEITREGWQAGPLSPFPWCIVTGVDAGERSQSPVRPLFRRLRT